MKKLVILFLFILSGCASTPAPTDYGRVMNTEECRDLAIAYFNGSLKDPESATYRWAPCKKTVDIGPLFSPDIAGYAIYMMVNAKNSYGGYTGEKGYNVVLKNGTVIRVWDCSNERNCQQVY